MENSFHLICFIKDMNSSFTLEQDFDKNDSFSKKKSSPFTSKMLLHQNLIY